MGGLCFITGTAAAFAGQVEAASQPVISYTVEPSDTLWGISRSCGITVGTLKNLNGLRTDTIYVGEHLNVPEQQVSETTDGGGRSQAPAPTPHIPGLPTRLIPVYKAAARPYHVPWTVLAAIHKTETGFAVSDCPKSSDGAEGPFQFMPSTFQAYAVKGPGHHGIPSIQNVSDAASTAAHMLEVDGFAKNPRAALFAYNHSTAYVHQILTLAGLHPRRQL